MLAELLQTTKLFHLFHRIDIDLAVQQRKVGCPFCGGALHYSTYQRKPRGGSALPDLCKRLSFCCGNETCCLKTLPASIIFKDWRVSFLLHTGDNFHFMTPYGLTGLGNFFKNTDHNKSFLLFCIENSYQEIGGQ